ncbi:hypothetical protein OXPF_37610 [Oxobacter pfennigii]|uniref:Uncharacterized protein n=1 Tax=Oxobacter pfennigii TaxID=36849 RepID=A0A0P8YSP6_9CLOT|nr:hypothetical protein [Oxobacter pfennigii]KPU42707.1 hypothetical protein OXPF_37610 [Oxobacter pfennigii]
MPNMFLNLFIETGVYSNKTSKVLINNYQYSCMDLTDRGIENLYYKILMAKGDWISLLYNNFNNNFHVDISLIFHTEFQFNENDEIINNVKKICDDFVKDSKVGGVNNHYDNHINLEELASDKCCVLSLFEGGGGVINFDLVKQTLDENKLDYSVITQKITRFDGGASGGSEEFIAFLSSTIVSGVTWDIIKMAIASKLGIDIDRIIIDILDAAKFKLLRLEIADKIREKSKDLYLKKFEDLSSKLRFIFGCKNTEIEVICDKEYKIKSLNVKK